MAKLAVNAVGDRRHRQSGVLAALQIQQLMSNWFHAAKAGHKLDCLRAAPAVCVEVDHFIRLRSGPRACDDWSSTYESVIRFGTAEIVKDAAEKLRGLRALMRKYSGRENWEFPDPTPLSGAPRCYASASTRSPASSLQI